MRRALCLSLVLGLLAGPLYAAAPPPAEDAEVRKGVQQVNTGAYDAGILTLDAASRRLAASRDNPQELSQAYLYLGIAYLAKGRDSAAEANFRQALAQTEALNLPPDKFAQRVLEVFEKSRAQRTTPAAAQQPPPPAAAQRPATAAAQPPPPSVGAQRPPTTPEKHYGSSTTFAVAGIAVAATGAIVAISANDPDTNAFGQIYQNSFAGLEAGRSLFFDIPVRGPGSLAVTVDWQSATSSIDISLVPLACMGEPTTCPTIVHAGRGGKPESFLATVTPGTYRVVVSRSGRDAGLEAGSIQAVLTR